MHKKVILLLGAAFFLALGFSSLSKQGTSDRPLDEFPRVRELEGADKDLPITAGFSIDTSGDQGCFVNCPKPALKIWVRYQGIELIQSIRSCTNVGFGDPFFDGADCDGEHLFLKLVGSDLHVLSGEGKSVYQLSPAKFLRAD